MLKYILKRFAYMFVTLFIITAATFFLMHSIPGDPLSHMAKKLPERTRENYYQKYGLDKPVITQFGIFLKNIVTEGNFGESLRYPGRSVTDTIVTGSKASAIVGIQALFWGVLAGVALGVIAAIFKNRWPDYLIMFIAILGVTIPVFVFASVVQYFFTVKYRLLPTTGWGGFKYMVLPVITLALGSIAGYARYMRSSVLEVVNQDYILTARAKGASEGQIIKKHILRNSLIPALTILGPEIAAVFTGAFVTEKMFGIPGLGFYYVSSINDRDYTMIIGTTVFYAILFVAVQLVIDILYGVVDPRISLADDKE